MAKRFNAVPLFDSYRYFFQHQRDELFPDDWPSIQRFMHKIETTVPGATQDFYQVKQFLWSKGRKSEATFNTFRSEAERFLLWAWCIKQNSIAYMKKRDFEEYLDFVVKPPKSWIDLKMVPRFRTEQSIRIPNPEWRPFVVKVSKAERKEFELNNPGHSLQPDKKHYSLKNKSIMEVFSNLSSLYNHLVDEEYAFGNPLPSVKRSSPYLVVDVANDSVKRLSPLQWEYVLESTKAQADQDPAWERHLFIIACMKSLYLRVSELSVRKNWTPTMGDFYQEEGNWWLRVFGKGNKKRKVSVPDDFLFYLIRYRNSRGLDDYPSVGESTPLLEPIRKKSPGLQTRAIALAAQQAFDLASQKLLADGFGKDAKILLAASTHWLRHTGASMDVEFRPLKDLSADLGHGKLGTTDKEYVHADDQERAASGKKRRV